MVAGGCGSEPSTSTTSAAEPPAKPDELSASEQRRTFEAQQAITAYCGRVDLSLHGQGRPPSAARARQAKLAADRLAELARERPFDLVQTGVDTRLYVGDLLEDLSNVDCDPDVVAALERGLG